MGVLRNITQRFENVLKWPTTIKCESIVQTTLKVQIRENGKVFFLRSLRDWSSVLIRGVVSSAMDDSDVWDCSVGPPAEVPFVLLEKHFFNRLHIRLNGVSSDPCRLSSVSSVPTSTPMAAKRKIAATMILGPRYGYFEVVSLSFELSKPPRRGPRRLPAVAQNGSSRSARARWLDSVNCMLNH